ncbi:2-keto-4-pentenoate hydratase [Pseudonocardia sp. RS010]|uniref:2-keto-4-pentenoate hydratase n=1 Tax=Pseudonocardia sp. RS010 TaxID=3385979 RepID=UPI0039A18BDA
MQEMDSGERQHAATRAARLLERADECDVDVAELNQLLGSDMDLALRTQLLLADVLEASGDEVAGWKVGLTSGAAHDMMGRGVRPFGHIPRSRILPSGAHLAITGPHDLGIEPEIALRISRDIHEPIRPEDVSDSLNSVHAAFEINQFRLGPDRSHASLVADNLTHWGVVLGPGVAPTPDPHLDPVRVDHNQEHLGAFLPSPMDHPYRSLAALTSQLARFGRHLRAGDVVITGSFSRHDLVRGDVWTAEFTRLPSTVTVTW